MWSSPTSEGGASEAEADLTQVDAPSDPQQRRGHVVKRKSDVDDVPRRGPADVKEAHADHGFQMSHAGRLGQTCTTRQRRLTPCRLSNAALRRCEHVEALPGLPLEMFSVREGKSKVNLFFFFFHGHDKSWLSTPQSSLMEILLQYLP